MGLAWRSNSRCSSTALALMAPLRRFGSTDTRQDLTPITPNLIAWLHRRSQNRVRLADITPSKRIGLAVLAGAMDLFSRKRAARAKRDLIRAEAPLPRCRCRFAGSGKSGLIDFPIGGVQYVQINVPRRLPALACRIDEPQG